MTSSHSFSHLCYMRVYNKLCYVTFSRVFCLAPIITRFYVTFKYTQERLCYILAKNSQAKDPPAAAVDLAIFLPFCRPNVACNILAMFRFIGVVMLPVPRDSSHIPHRQMQPACRGCFQAFSHRRIRGHCCACQASDDLSGPDLPL